VLLLLLTILSAPLAAADAPATATQAEETGRMSPLQARLYRSVDLERFSPSLPLEGLVRLPTEAGNAADHYAKLETLYLREKHEDGMGVPIDSEGVMEILAASRIRDCRLTPTWYPHMSVGTARQPDLLVYHAYLEALLEAAERLEDAGNLKGASTVHQAGIVWGWHFMNDRSSLVTFLLGLSIQAKAGEAYADFLKRNMHVQKGRKVDDYVEAIGDLRRRTFVKANIHLGDMANFHCLFSAIRVAKEDADYFWRQEAVLRLGVFQHGAPDTIQGGLVTNAAHQETARAALAAIAAAGDERPWIRELAAWTGENMTPERYAEIRAEGIFRVSSEVLDEGGEEVTTNPARPTESVTP
jgi:hypothetical protein